MSSNRPLFFPLPLHRSQKKRSFGLLRCSVGKCPVLLKCSPPERKNRRSAARPADAITFVNSYKTLIRRICSFPDFIPRFVKGCVGKTGRLSKPCSGRRGFPRSEGFAVPGKAFEDTPGIFSMSSPQRRSPVSMADIPIFCQSDKTAHPGLFPLPSGSCCGFPGEQKEPFPGLTGHRCVSPPLRTYP